MVPFKSNENCTYLGSRFTSQVICAADHMYSSVTAMDPISSYLAHRLYIVTPEFFKLLFLHGFTNLHGLNIHKRKSHNRPCLQLKASGQQFYKRLFYNGGLQGKRFWAVGEFLSCNTLSGHREKLEGRLSPLIISNFYDTFMDIAHFDC